jgi:single-stranded DNA-binding protein
MFAEAEFSISGNVGDIRQVGTALKISICANCRRKDDRGNWVDDPHWNSVTVWRESTQKYIQNHVRVGDQVRATGIMRDRTYEHEGETRYTTDRIALRLGRFGAKRDGDAAGEDGQDDQMPD